MDENTVIRRKQHAMPQSLLFPDHVWHITHRCHKKEFLLAFAKDLKHWLYLLFDARNRSGRFVVDYIITSNHIHLLLRDCGQFEIMNSIQLVAGRIALEFNRRKHRKARFW